MKTTNKESLDLKHFLISNSTIIFMAAIFVILAISVKDFLTISNLVNILSQNAILMIVSCGLCFMVAIGGIDLSLTISYDFGALVAVVMMKYLGLPWFAAFCSGLLAGILLGAVNGLIVTKLRIGIFIATLGTMYIGQSIQKIITTGGQPIYLSKMSPAYKFLGKGNIISFSAGGMQTDVKFSILVAILVMIGVSFLLRRTTFGRRLNSIGAQAAAADLCGVPIQRYTFYAFMLCGAICALGGMINSSVLSSYMPLSGNYHLMNAIGAVFIGCTLDKRGMVNVSGTALGVLFFGLISNALNLVGMSNLWQNVVRGVLIFLVLMIDAYKKTRLIDSKREDKK